MDSNGKADPYVEVSLKPGHEKFTTSIKPKCLNPTFNEMDEFSLLPGDIEKADLVLKVMDSDFPQADELIGTIRLPIRSLNLSNEAKHYSCLILHDKLRNRHELTALDAAKLNIKISKNEQQLELLRNELAKASEMLQLAREKKICMRNTNVDLQIENNTLETERLSKFDEMSELEEDLAWSDPESGQKVHMRPSVSRQRSRSYCDIPRMTERRSDNRLTSLHEENFNESPPSSLSLSPESSTFCIANIISGTAHEECLEHLNMLRNRISSEDQKISQLTKMVQLLEPSSKNNAKRGSIVVGLSFHHISSRLKISLLSASKLHVTNASGHAIERRPNPYAKIKVFLRNATAYKRTYDSSELYKPSRKNSVSSCKRDSTVKGKNSYRWKFTTQIAYDITTPAWNEHFEIDDISEEDLSNIHIVITVMDHYPVLPNKPLGQTRIGPGNRNNPHWEEMLTHHGSPVTMEHRLEDI